MNRSPVRSANEAIRILAALITTQHGDEFIDTSLAALLRDDAEPAEGFAMALHTLTRGSASRVEIAAAAFTAGVLYERDAA